MQKSRLGVAVSLAAIAYVATPFAQSPWLDAYREPARRLIAEGTSTSFAWDRLAELGDTFGHRLSGSENLDAAIKWAASEMRRDGLDVRLDPVKVPHWVRGAESLEIVAPGRHPLTMLGLGNSVGTPPAGIEAELLIVHSFRELDSAGDSVKGRIVLFHVPFTTYGETVAYRSDGPSRAAAKGAVAVLIRAVGPAGLRTPHTGMLRYADGQPQIPAAAVSAEDADRLQRMQKRGTNVRLRLRMEAKFLPDADSFNVIGELRGRELPDEVVVVSGHFDSWDVGTGSTDDGGGCVVSWEAVRLMKKLGLRPRRTVRVVLFTNEENGLRGGLDYRDRYKAQLAQSRADVRVGQRRLQAIRVRLLGNRQRPQDDPGDRDTARGHRHQHDQRQRRRRRHRPERPGRERARDVPRRGRKLLPDPSHARRHDRQDRPEGHGDRLRRHRRHGLCGG